MKQIDRSHQHAADAPEAGRIAAWWRNPYCWLILAGPMTVIVAGLVTAWIAISGADPLVDKNYYQKGIALSQGAQTLPGALLPAHQARNHAATGGSPTGIAPVGQ